MRILITLKQSPAHKYLVNLFTKALIDEIKELINSRRHLQAVRLAFAKGKIERRISEEDFPTLRADLILSEDNARWDLMS